MMAGLGMAFMACDEIDESSALPQSNPQLDMIKAENVKVESAVTSTIDFATAPASVEVARVEDGTDWPEGYVASVPFAQVSTTEDFAEYRQLDATMGDNGAVYVDTDAWDDAQLAMVGKNPAEVTYYVRCAVNATGGGQTIRMGGGKHFYGNFPVKIKPIDLFGGQVIEQEYYIVTSSTGWDISKAVKCNHTDKDAYDDPSFSAIINVPDGGVEYVVIPGTTYYAGSFGLNYGVDAFGALVESTGALSSEPGNIAEKGPHMISINMLDLTCEQKLAIEFFYTPGQSNGWNHQASQKIGTRDYVNYCGYANLEDGFKFSSGETWDQGLDLGYASPGVLNLAPGCANITVEQPGLYYCWLDPIALKYTLTLVSSFGVIGNATPGGWDAETALSPSADYLIWSGEMELTDGELKFRANNGWDINLGGSVDNLYQNEGNLASPGAGKYLVTLDLSTIPYTCSFTKQ